MSGGPMILDLTDGEAREGWLQPLAGQEVWSSFALAPDARMARRPDVSPSARHAAEPWRLVYDGPGEIDGGVHRIRSLVDSAGRRRIEFEDGESFEIEPDGRVLSRRDEGAGTDRSAERSLGAPLAVALAMQRIFLLHASAVAGRSGVLALVAPSGGGKSTLAAAAARDPESGWTRIADDQLAVRLGEAPAALPHFPQLKLPDDAQYPANAPASRPLAAVFVLGVEDGAREPRGEPLPAAEGLSVLTAATVAARLFDRELLAGHFAACAEAARAIPCFRLTAPRDLSRLDEALRALAVAIP